MQVAAPSDEHNNKQAPAALQTPTLDSGRYLVLVAGAALYALLSAIDYLCFERDVPYALTLRLGVAVVLLLSLWRYARDVRSPESFDRLQCLLSVMTVLSLEYAAPMAPASLHALYVAALVLSWMYSAFLAQMSLSWLAPLMAFSFLLHNFAGILHEQRLTEALLDDLIMLASAAMIAWASWLMARHRELWQQETRLVQLRFMQLQEAHVRLEELSTRDALTGLENRRSFEDRYDAEWRRCFRAGHELGVMVIDVDYFKQYNDSCGHLAGDQCLRRVAQVIACAARRPGDIVARFGGEEFVVVWPQARAEDLLQEAQRLCAAVREAAIVHPGSAYGWLTISVGVACHVPDAQMGPRRLFECADAALYRAKRQGRDRVEIEAGMMDAGLADLGLQQRVHG